jgi:hypothetical protein
MVAMVFTARFDYKGSFWNALQNNLDEPDLDQAAWGQFFRGHLREFRLFSPPEHWMINVFPVLYHAIIPESSKQDFGIMVRSLTESLDVRDLDDRSLLVQVRSYDLPSSLEAFIDSPDSAPVACDLIRQVAEDFRQLRPEELDTIDESTIRGALLASVARATITERARFKLRERLLVWRWDLGSGEIGAYLTATTSFDELPLRLRIGGEEHELDCYRDHDERWSLSGQLIPVSLQCAGRLGEIDFASGAPETVRLAAAHDPPLFFRATGNTGIFAGDSGLESGLFAIAAREEIMVFLGSDEVPPLEILPPPNVSGIQYAAIYDLTDDHHIQVGEKTFSVRGRMRAAAMVSKTSLWSLVVEKKADVPVYSESPRLRFDSPQSGSSYRIIDQSSNQIVARAPFDERASVKPDLPLGTTYRATVLIDDRSSGSSAVDLALLPIDSVGTVGHGNQAVVGQGELQLDSRTVQLSSTPSAMTPSELFASEPLRYEFRGRHYRIRYLGPRTIMWRLPGGTFSQELLDCDTSDTLQDRQIEFRGTPGSAIAFISPAGQLDARLGANGRLSIGLRQFHDVALDRFFIELGVPNGRVPCVAITRAPVVEQVDLGVESPTLREFGVAGSVLLDRSVDKMQLVLTRYREPWFPAQHLDMQGFACDWDARLELAPAEYKLTLRAELDGHAVQVLDQAGIWSRIIGHKYANHDWLEGALYAALSGHEDAFRKLSATSKSRSTTLALCTKILEQADNPYKDSIPRIFEQIGQAMTSADLPAMDSISDSASLSKNAALWGLPMAAATQLPILQGVIDEPTDIPSIVDMEFLDFMLQVARTTDGAQAAAVIDYIVDDDTAPALRRAYAALLRITLASDLSAQLERLEDEMERPAVLRARFDSARLLELSGMPLQPVLDLPTTESLFAKCVSAIWLFSFASRVFSRSPASDAAPQGTILLSRWLYHSLLGPLSRIALAKAESACNAVEERLKTC